MSESRTPSQVQIQPWSDVDLALLQLINAPEMMDHLGGPETDAQLLKRHERYLKIGERGTGRMFSIVLLPSHETVGSVGYWDSHWQGEHIYEIGWSVLTPYQGRGIATAAVAEAIGRARNERVHRYMHAYPSIHNPASNAVCRKLHFFLVAPCEFEYPPGHRMQCNNWRVDLDKTSAWNDKEREAESKHEA